jgi:hypothetical protein
MKHLRKRLSYANVMSSLAVFLVLGGGVAAAALLPKNSVGSRELKPNAVRTPDIARNAVKTGKVGPEAVKAGKLAKNAVPTNRLRDNAVTTDKVVDGAILTDKLGDKAVKTDKLDDAAATRPKLADSSVYAEKLAPITIRTNTVVVAKEERGVVAVSCEGNERMIGGGGGFDIVTAAPHPSVIMSMNQGPNTWRVRGFNPSAAFDRTLTARIFCLDG